MILLIMSMFVFLLTMSILHLFTFPVITMFILALISDNMSTSRSTRSITTYQMHTQLRRSRELGFAPCFRLLRDRCIFVSPQSDGKKSSFSLSLEQARLVYIMFVMDFINLTSRGSVYRNVRIDSSNYLLVPSWHFSDIHDSVSNSLDILSALTKCYPSDSELGSFYSDILFTYKVY